MRTADEVMEYRAKISKVLATLGQMPLPQEVRDHPSVLAAVRGLQGSALALDWVINENGSPQRLAELVEKASELAEEISGDSEDKSGE